MEPDQWVYLNGEVLPRSEATLDIEDRAALFADGVYEVIAYHHGRPFAMAGHVERLHRSLAAIDISLTEQIRALPAISEDLVERHGFVDARVYWQVSRGVTRPRSHVGDADAAPTLLALCTPADPLPARWVAKPVSAILVDDQRWARCDIKSLMLLPNVLAKRQADAAGADEALFVRGGVVTEGAATSLFMVRDRCVFTHPADHCILPGVTRAVLLALADELAASIDVKLVEQAFTPAELLAADEAFIAGTTTLVAPVTHIDGQPIATGALAGEPNGKSNRESGSVTQAMGEALVRRMHRECRER